MASSSVSVLVIEKHPMLREALCAAIELEAGLRVAESLADSSQVIDAALHSRPAVILFSLANPGQDDLQALLALTSILPEIPVLALVTDELPNQGQAALEHGAWAVLGKTATRLELLKALRQAAAPNREHPPPTDPKEAIRPNSL